MDNSVTVRTPAKINLLLDIVGKRTDGYHFMKTVMQAISLYDEVTVEKDDGEEITISCSDEKVPCDSRNLAYKAAEAFFGYTKLPRTGLKIEIEKNIPMQAGLAGGSTDAAAVLRGMNELFEAGLPDDELADIAVTIGADVPFCLIGGTALAEGIGEMLTPLPNLSGDCFILIAKPSAGISTVEAYAKYDALVAPEHPEYNDLIAAIAVGGIDKIAPYCKNVLEAAADLPEIEEIKKIMLDNGALGASMTGSGSAVFGIFEKKKQASACEDDLSKLAEFTKICTPEAGGAEII